MKVRLRRLHRIHKADLPFGAKNFLSILEGLEGGFAISTGIVAGLTFAPVGRQVVLITFVISILVNGFNASAVKFSSEHYDDELDGHEKRGMLRHYFMPAALVFLVYLVACAITLLPLLIIEHFLYAVLLSVSLTLIILFASGWYRGRLLRTHPLRDALELAISGLFIISVGAVAGYALSL